jgi:hypothetical protein
MIEQSIPPLLGRLSHDIILVYDAQHTILEANPLALRLLGSSVVGRSIMDVMTDMSEEKAQMFLGCTHELALGEMSDIWELLFEMPNAEPMLINVRAGFWQPGRWLLVGMCESPQLTALYHEVLAMNTELTNMIRELCREQARLSSQVSRLLQNQTQEHTHDGHNEPYYTHS